MSAPASRMWARVSPILDELLERPEAEWAGLVEQRCGGDEELRREVLRLLSAHAHAGGFLSQPAFDLAPTFADQAASAAEPERAAPASVGPWRVVRELGGGGMGVVYLAERAGEQFRQRAALKLVRTGLDSEEVLARFHRERRILASLDHPHIARLLDGGRSEDGRPYLAMEYVEGQPLTAYCRERALGVEERLRLFLSICKAVQHAHSRLVVHRDLKPSNILVTGTGEPRLLDFGIAKLLAEEEGDRALTRTGLSVMTPDYAAPEQLRHEPVSTATDVYALGVILYELLARRHPFRDRDQPSGASDATVRPEPPAPSTVCEDKTLRRRLAGDLDTIVRMTLREEPARRYASAEALGRDIERHLAALPVSARPDTLGYRTRKFVRRHRLAVAAAAALTLTAGSALLALSYALSAVRGRLAEAERAEAIQSFLVDTLGEADPARARGHETTVREALDRGAARLPTALTRQPRTRGELLRTMGALYHALGHDDRATPLLAEALRLAEAEYGPGSVEVGRVLLEKADTHYWYDSNEAALATWQRALAIFRAVPGDHRREVAKALDGVGLVQRQLGHYEEAERSHREALAVARAVQGGDSPAVAKELTSLANTLHRAGRDEEAMDAAADAVRIYRAGGESVLPDLAEALENLGLALAGGGRPAEAEAPLQESLALRRRIYGQEHPVVLDGFNSWASLLETQGRIAEALPLRRDALAVARRVLTGGDLAVHINNLALLCYRSGDWACAENGFREALGLWHTEYGERHPHVATAHNNLGMALMERGRLGEAEAEVTAALALRRALAGEESAEVAVSSRNIGLIQLRQGRLPLARIDLDRAVELSRRVYEPRHPRLAEALIARADLALAEKRRQDAVRDLEEALAIREEKLGRDNPLTAKARAQLERARGGRATGRP